MIVCTRRRALLLGSAFAASGPLATLAEALPRAEDSPARGTRLHAVLQDGVEAGIASFVWSGDAWRQQQFFPSASARQLAASPDGRQIFVTHAAQDARDAAGVVETWHVQAQTASLTRGKSQSLALSARVPARVALAPDGRMLVVAARGGVLSLLPVDADGAVGEVVAAYKHLRLAAAAMQPASMVFSNPSELHIACDAQTLRFHCDASGFRHLGVADVRPAQVTQSVFAVPEGVVSSVLLPPISV